MKKPIVLIFCSRSDNRKMHMLRTNYMTSLSNEGLIPIIAPMFATREDYAELCAMADGFLFSGGADVHPSRYGEEVLPVCGEIDETRDKSEYDALPEAIATGKPIFAICRGIQLLGAFTGGKLYQDLPSQRPSDVLHSQNEDPSVCSHGVSIKKGTLLYSIIGKEEIRVNSFHHQAIRETSLSVCAYSEDGVIEGVEDPSHPFFLGVQWHPEHTAHCDEDSRVLFSAFADAVRKGMQK